MTLEILRVYYTNKATFENFERLKKRDLREPGRHSADDFLFFSVETIEEAKTIIKTADRVAHYKEPFAFTFGGLEVLDEEANEWQEWRDEQGRDITKLIKIDEINAA